MMRRQGWMRVSILLVAGLLLGIASCGEQAGPERVSYGIVIHGGAGTIERADMTSDQEQAYRAKMQEALAAGHKILAGGGTSLDAVQAAINVMEDSPLFNAGKGAVFTADGTNELDASIMDGKSLNAGAVAGVKRIRNPINAARMVMEQSEHVMLSGQGAEVFAAKQGIRLVDQEYFFTRRRWEALMERREEEGRKEEESSGESSGEHGTVGAVALDQAGNLAAGTSTGGMTYKQYGRIGDSPIIGAGTYADNRTCAISATGHGEYFIRLAVAHSISARMAYQGLSLSEAARKVIREDLVSLGGYGGIIGIDTTGTITMEFNTSGMYRGYQLGAQQPVVKIYRNTQ